jgi:hypothetical protein
MLGNHIHERAKDEIGEVEPCDTLGTADEIEQPYGDVVKQG